MTGLAERLKNERAVQASAEAPGGLAERMRLYREAPAAPDRDFTLMMTHVAASLKALTQAVRDQERQLARLAAAPDRTHALLLTLDDLLARLPAEDVQAFAATPHGQEYERAIRHLRSVSEGSSKGGAGYTSVGDA